MTTPCRTVLILASDPGFAREITAHWPQQPAPNSRGPEFIVLDEGLTQDLQGSHYDLAIADACSLENHSEGNAGKRRRHFNKLLNRELKQTLAAKGLPAILVHSDPSLPSYSIHGTIHELRRDPGVWPAVAGLLGREILCRVEAEARAREAEQACAAAQAEATLGRYMIEMRTNINNALTTVLGNSELLSHEPGLPAMVHIQADAMRNMALRLHEIFQRFSSIEKELNVAARDSSQKKTHAAAAGH